MNISKIREAVNSNIPEQYIEQEILDILSQDENVVSTLLSILGRERKFKKELQLNMNLMLSKAHTVLDEPKLNKDGFVQEEIVEFYKKYKGHVGHCFNVKIE